MSVRDYIVIVQPPGEQTPNMAVAHPPRVVRITRVNSPDEAAARADVPPGGYCIVVVRGQRFDRAMKAPLVEREMNGDPLPQEGLA